MRHTSYFIGGPLNKKKTVTQLNICQQIIYRDKQHIVHLYQQHSIDKEKSFVCYRYVGPATKNFDGEWIPDTK